MEKEIIAKSHTLGKTERLKSRKRIDQLFAEGKSFLIAPLRVYYNFSSLSGSPLQAGFSASSRTFKKAVDRNRIKRVMREAYRLQKMPLSAAIENKNQSLAVFFIYTARDLPVSTLVHEKMALALQKMIVLTNEAFPADM